MKNAIAILALTLVACAKAIPASESHFTRVDGPFATLDAAEAGCQAVGGTLATLEAPADLQTIADACAAELPADLTPCWTAIDYYRDGAMKILVIAPFQPTFDAVDADVVESVGFNAVCRVMP